MSDQSGLYLTVPEPYTGAVCTRRDHVVGWTKIDPTDTRAFRCDCGCAMIGNAFVEIRFGLLDSRFPLDKEADVIAVIEEQDREIKRLQEVVEQLHTSNRPYPGWTGPKQNVR